MNGPAAGAPGRVDRLRRLQRLGRRGVDQPAAPHVPPGRRRATACSSSSRSACAGHSWARAAICAGSSGACAPAWPLPGAVTASPCSRRSSCRCTRNRAVRMLNRFVLRRQVGAAARRLGMQRPVLWAYVPQAEALLEHPGPRVRHLSLRRRHRGPGGDRRRELHAPPSSASPRGPTSCWPARRRSRERMRTLSTHVVLAPNVADTALFATALKPGPLDPAARRGRRAADRVRRRDRAPGRSILTLVARIATARPHWSLVLVGPDRPGRPRHGRLGAAAPAERPPARAAEASRALPPCCGGPTRG